MSANPTPSPIEIIDEEHRAIHRAIVRLTDSIIAGAGVDTLIFDARDVVRVALVHFEHEEAILEAIGYERLQQHKAVHEEARKMLATVEEQLEKREVQPAMRGLQQFREWVYAHFESEDDAYCDEVNRYAAKAGLSPLPARIRHLGPPEPEDKR